MCDVPSGISIQVNVRVEPNDTVRVSQTVRLTATVAGNDRASVAWYLWGGTRVGSTVELPAPSVPGTYFGTASAACGVDEGRSNFSLVALP